MGVLTIWITEPAQEWVEAAESETGHPTDAVSASQVVSDDLMRWPRWWLGLGTFVGAFFAAGTAGSLGMALVVDGPGDVGSVGGWPGGLRHGPRSSRRSCFSAS